MNILIDVGHPAHVHLFKNFAIIMKNKGHNIVFTARDKESIIELLKKYNFTFYVLGVHKKYLVNKLITLLTYNYKLLKFCKAFLPEIFLSHGSPYAAHVSAILDKPHISFEDTEHSIEQILLYKPFTDQILTSNVFKRDLGKKQIRYNSFHEIAYLHPDYFTPNLEIKKELNLAVNEKFVIIRFVSWAATHDLGYRGLDIKINMN